MSDRIERPDPWAPVPAADFVRLLLQTGFSLETYRSHFSDLAQMNWKDTDALSHFLLCGLNERRVMPLTLNRQALLTLAQTPMRDTKFKAKLLTFLAGHLFDDTDHPYGLQIRDRWPTIQLLTNEGARPYFVAGDSHTNQYRLTGDRNNQWLLPVHILCTGGSATGLGNPASRSGYGALLLQAVQVIETLPDLETIPFLLQFGQVDIEFVYHFQRVRDGRLTLNLDEYRTFCKQTLDHYIRFVIDLFPPPRRMHLFLVSLFPPALSDAAWHKGYVNADLVRREASGSAAEMSSALRTLQVATLQQRTEIHLYYNDLLRLACEHHGLSFVDSATPFLGDSRIVDPRYIVPEADGTEHHLDDRVTNTEIRRLIWQCIDIAHPSRA